MISKTLSLWIAQSESWQTFMDFRLPDDSIAKYPFLNRPEDFYISLFGEMYDILENLEEKKDDILSVAKGLEIFSLRNKRDKFVGVNQPNNILFAAGLYYLSDYAASAYILANLYDVANYEREIDKFVLCFLKRKLDEQNTYCNLLNQYLTTGDENIIQELLQRIEAQKNIAYKHNPYEFSICFLAESILKKFRTNNIWTDLLKHNTPDHWSSYIDKTTKKSFPVWDFFPSQKTALEKGALAAVAILGKIGAQPGLKTCVTTITPHLLKEKRAFAVHNRKVRPARECFRRLSHPPVTLGLALLIVAFAEKETALRARNRVTIAIFDIQRCAVLGQRLIQPGLGHGVAADQVVPPLMGNLMRNQPFKITAFELIVDAAHTSQHRILDPTGNCGGLEYF